MMLNCHWLLLLSGMCDLWLFEWNIVFVIAMAIVGSDNKTALYQDITVAFLGNEDGC